MNITEQFISVVAYGRSSSDQQKTSHDIQDDEHGVFATELAQRIIGKPAKIIHSYADHGVSGSKKNALPKRHDFNRMLSDMEAGTIQQTGQPFPNFIVVLNTSRFSRLHPVDTMKFYSLLKDAGVKLISIHDRKVYDPEQFNDMLVAIIKAEQDRQYAKGLAYNILGGMKHANAKGQNTTSVPPVGMARLIVADQGAEKIIPRLQKYRCGDDEKSFLIPGDQVEQKIINLIFDKFTKDDISYNALARMMNQHDDQRYRLGPQGNGWSQQTIQGLLKNHHLAGWEYIGKKRTKGHATLDNGLVTATDMAVNPPDPILTDVTLPNIGHAKQGCVVDRDKFNKAQSVMESRSSNKRRCCNQDYPLSGILRCQCGGPLYANKDKNGSVRYGCKKSRQMLAEHKCGWWSVKQDEVLPAILQLIDGELWKQSHEQPPQEHGHQDDQHQQKIDSVNRKIDQLRNSIDMVDDKETISMLSQNLKNAVVKRRQLIQQEPKFNKNKQQDIIDRWHEFSEPLLVSVPTAKANQTFNKIKSLFPNWTKKQIKELADEGDRLFNTASVRPSRVRQVLNDVGITVQFTFKPSDRQLGGKKRRLWAIDTAKVSMGADSQDLELDKPGSPGRESKVNHLKTVASPTPVQSLVIRSLR